MLYFSFKCLILSKEKRFKYKKNHRKLGWFFIYKKAYNYFLAFAFEAVLAGAFLAVAVFLEEEDLLQQDFVALEP